MEPMCLLAHCILGKFLGIVCHCFSPSLEVPTFATTCLCLLRDARDPSSERWNCGRERCQVVILPRKFRDLLHAANLRHGTDGFTSPPKEGVLRTSSGGFEPANLGTKGQHATSRPPTYVLGYSIKNKPHRPNTFCCYETCCNNRQQEYKQSPYYVSGEITLLGVLLEYLVLFWATLTFRQAKLYPRIGA